MSSIASVLPERVFPGLRPFEEQDAVLFFGRDEQTDALLRRLDDTRFLAIVGLSGSGKSSLVRAGLLPALRRGHLSGAGPRWRIAVMRPGSDPLGALAATLDDDNVLGQLEGRLDVLRSGDFGLIDAGRFTRQPEENLLIVVDQFEEIFRFQRDFRARAGEATEFVRLLLSAVQQYEPTYRVYVVITMRSDYLGECAHFVGLPEVLNESQYLVPRMTRDQLREAIEGPAALSGIEVQSDLLERLLQESGSDADELPILQHLLMRMWEVSETSNGRPRLTLAQLEAVGGWEHALAQHAESMLSQLGDMDVVLTKRLFQQLTEQGEANRENRRPTTVRELAAVAEADEEHVRKLVEWFRQEGCNFLTSPNRQLAADSVIDVSHESLIRRWPRLTEWVEEEAQLAESFRRVQDASRQYAEQKKGLLDDLELHAALEARTKGRWNAAWAARYATVESSHLVVEGDASSQVFDGPITFLDKSRRSQRRRRFKKHLVVAALAAAPVFVLGFVVYHYWSRSLEVSRDAISKEEDPLLRAVLLPEVLGGLYWDDMSLFRLFDPMTMGPIPIAVLSASEEGGALMSAAFSGADGRAVSIVSASGTIFRWSSDGRGSASPVRLPQNPRTSSDPSDQLTAVAFSQDGEQIAFALGDGSAFLGRSDGSGGWTRIGGAQSDGWVTALAFNADGMQVAAGYSDQRLQIWNRDGTPGPVLSRAALGVLPIPGITFDSAGGKVAGIFSDGATRIWETSSPEKPPLILNPNSNDLPTSISFSADGNWVVSAYGDRAIILPIPPNPQEQPIELGDRKTTLSGAWFKPHDSSVVVVGLADGSAQVWRVPELSGVLRTSPYIAMTLAGHSRPVRAAFSSDGGRIVTISEDGGARVWDGREVGVLGHHARRIESVAFRPDGNKVVSASDDNSAVIWAVDDGRSERITEHTDWVRSAVFSPDGATVATASEDGRWLLHPRPSAASPAIPTPGDRIFGVAFDARANRIVTSHQDATAKVWSLNDTNQPQRVLTGHSGSVFSARFSPDGARVVTGSADGTARIWDLASGRAKVTFSGHGDSDRVFSASFSPDGTSLVTASSDNTARVWGADGRELFVLRHNDAVNQAEFSSDGKRVVTASDDKTVRIWNVADGSEAIQLLFDGRMRSASFDPTNEFVAAGDEYGRVYVWPVTTRAMRTFIDKWRGASTACAPVEKRVQLLGESRSRAESTYSDCERRYDRLVQQSTGG